MSDYDNIYYDNLKHLNKYKNEPPSNSYIAGFIDGDGCIFIRKIKDGFQTGISITQCRTNILQILKYHFGGIITRSFRKNKNDYKIIDFFNKNKTNNHYINTTRNQFNLIIRSNEYNFIINYLYDKLIIKNYHYQCLYRISKYVNIQNTNEIKNEIYKKYLDFSYSNIDIDNLIDRLNIDYISGLFDAEGCLYINKNNYNKFYISITQKQFPILIHKIIDYLKFGNIDENFRFKIYNKSHCLKFIEIIKNKCIVKYNQIIAFETFLITNDHNIKSKMYNICNYEKHSSENFYQCNKNNIGNELFIENTKLHRIKILIHKQIINKNIYLQKSINMMGINNHNYGKKLSDSIKSKISLSNIKIKRKIDDETIEKVLNMLKNGHKNVYIQNTLNLPRHTVTRIKNGKINILN